MDSQNVPTSPILQNELNSLLQKFAKESMGQPNPTVTPALVDAPSSDGSPSAPAVPNVATPASADGAPATTAPTPAVPATTPAPVATAPAVDPDAPVDSWDSTPTQAAPVQASAPAQTQPTPTPQPQSFSILAKVLGNEKLSTEQEVAAAVEDIKQKAEMLTTLPPDLAKAVEIAKNNGNYLEYLKVSAVDWTKEDPVILYENYVVNQFTTPQGEVDYDRVEKFLEKLDDDEKELRGRELQNQYVGLQRQQQSLYEAQAQAARREFETSLRQTIDALDKISDFKVSPVHKQELYDYISKGEDLKESSIASRVQNAFVKKYFTKLDSFRKTQLRNAVKKEILDSITVPDISTPGSVAVQDSTPKRFSLDDYVKNLQIARS